MLFGACCDHPFSFSVFVFASLNLSVTRCMSVCLSPPDDVCLCLRSCLFVFPLSISLVFLSSCLSRLLYFLFSSFLSFVAVVGCSCCCFVWVGVCFFVFFTFVVFLFLFLCVWVLVIFCCLYLKKISSCWLSWECRFFFFSFSSPLPPSIVFLVFHSVCVFYLLFDNFFIMLRLFLVFRFCVSLFLGVGLFVLPLLFVCCCYCCSYFNFYPFRVSVITL